jgi:hypothetical protein
MPTFIARSGSFNNLRVSGSLSASGSVFLESLSTPPSAISNVLILSSSGQVFITASSALGGGGVTINPNVDDYLITATGTPNTLNGEPNLKFNGTALSLTGSMIASGSVFFPALTTTNQSDVLTIDTSTGQLFYTASTAIGGGGSSLIFSDGNTVPASNYSNTTTLYATGSGISITQGSPGVVSMSVAGPGGGDRSIQFNDGGTAFGGDNNLRYDPSSNLILEDSSNPSLINGSYSLVAGFQVTSSDSLCIVGGYGTTTTNIAQTVIGAFNTTALSTNRFVVGGGTSDSDRRDVLAVEADYLDANSPRIVKITGSLNSSGSVFFPALSTTSQNNVLTYNNSTGQLFYTASTAIIVSQSISSSFATSASYSLSSSFATTASYVTTLRAADPNKSIQFNSNGLLSGSGNFTFDSSSNKLVLSGSANIIMTGSDAGLQIFGIEGLRSILTGVPFLPSNIGSAWRQTQNVFVPSGSYGQIWSLITSQDSSPPIFIYNITSSNGDLQFKGSIGGSPNDGDKYKGYGIYASNLNKLLVGQGYIDDSIMYAFSASAISAQPDGFTASLGSAQELSLISYSSSMRLNGGTGEGIQANLFGWIWTPNPIIYTPSASVGYYTVCGLVTSSNGQTLLQTNVNSPLSASIYALSSSNQPISGAASLFPVGFLMSTFDSNTPSNELFVDLTPALTSSFNIPLEKIFNATFNGNQFATYNYASTVCGTYNPDLNRIYIVTRFASDEIGIVELDNDTTPPTVVSAVTSSGVYLNSIQNSQLVYNSLNQELMVFSGLGSNGAGGTPPFAPTTIYKIVDASATPLTTTNFTTPKATIATLGFSSPFSRTLPISNSFYGVSTIRGLSHPGITPVSSSIYYAYKIESGSGGYITSSQQIAVSYEEPRQGSYWLFEPTYASGSNINKIIAADRSNIGPIGNSSTYPENLITTFARAGYVYAIDTASLTTSSFYTPYTLAAGPLGINLTEYRQEDGTLLSYIDQDGLFVGPALKLVNSSSLPAGTPTTMASSGSKLFYYESGSESLHDGWVNYSPNKNVETDPTITINTDIIISTTGAVDIPAGMPVGKIFIIKGRGNAPDVTIDGSGTIDGNAIYALPNPDSAITIIHIGEGDYRIIGGYNL